jgi:adenylylsulfate kinase
MNGWAVWIIGMPGSGKSTIAHIVVRRLLRRRIHVQLLSIDMIRAVLTPRPTYSEEERDMVYDALVFVARMLTQNGVNVLIDATANRRRYRAAARRRIKRFAEIYLECPLEICMEREARRKRTFGAPSRIYAKARAGASKTVPGLGSPYEAPTRPELTVPTHKLKPAESADLATTFVLRRFG